MGRMSFSSLPVRRNTLNPLSTNLANNPTISGIAKQSLLFAHASNSLPSYGSPLQTEMEDIGRSYIHYMGCKSMFDHSRSLSLMHSPVSLSFVICNVPETSVVDVENPSVQSIVGSGDGVDINVNKIHHHPHISVVLTSQHVILHISHTMRGNSGPFHQIPTLHCNSPTQTASVLSHSYVITQANRFRRHFLSRREYHQKRKKKKEEEKKTNQDCH